MSRFPDVKRTTLRSHTSEMLTRLRRRDDATIPHLIQSVACRSFKRDLECTVSGQGRLLPHAVPSFLDLQSFIGGTRLCFVFWRGVGSGRKDRRFVSDELTDNFDGVIGRRGILNRLRRCLRRGSISVLDWCFCFRWCVYCAWERVQTLNRYRRVFPREHVSKVT
ncbi:hypothetical protein BDW02DRAFT_299897 [Decorospora gaudefroyi]|uniref:Uncharacterized protein n=1 Tax=Decorospora gaudefroyi TaxID=184978 RepID=A0A6A5KHG4_9PLEO|nr:hypothetical protein BDW02DRAFT_299897 [Decorospora gaudefroyi]